MKTNLSNSTATLMKAATEGDTAQAQRLIGEGADVNARDEFGRTALMTAARNGHTYIVRILLDSGADATARDKGGATALMAAESKGYARVISLLRSFSAASASGPAIVLQNENHATTLQKSLHHAADQGDAKLAEDLINQGASANAQTDKEWTPLMIATIKGHTEVAQTLLSKGADVNAKNNKGWTALMFAVSMGDVDTMRVLLNGGARADIVDNEGKTALMQAASENNIESVRVLLDCNADINIADRANETALAMAARRNYLEIVELLKKAAETNKASSADQSARDQSGPFGEACISTETLFNETELQRLKEELEGYLPQTWPVIESSENSIETKTQALVPSELSQIGERLIAAIEALRQSPPASTIKPPVSIAEVAHKIMLTLPEAAALSSLSRAHLRRAIGDGNLKAQKIGRGWRVKRAALDAYVRKL